MLSLFAKVPWTSVHQSVIFFCCIHSCDAIYWSSALRENYCYKVTLLFIVSAHPSSLKMKHLIKNLLGETKLMLLINFESSFVIHRRCTDFPPCVPGLDWGPSLFTIVYLAVVLQQEIMHYGPLQNELLISCSYGSCNLFPYVSSSLYRFHSIIPIRQMHPSVALTAANTWSLNTLTVLPKL